jgi:hypothetical protein
MQKRQACLVASLGLVLLVMVPIRAQGCQQGSLLARVNEASLLVANGSPVAALVCYDAIASSEVLLQNDSPLVEERFWFEYHDAALQAASLVPDKRDFYLARVIDVGDSYAQWYRTLDDDSRQQLAGHHQDRLSNVLFDTASAYEALHQKDDLLGLLEQFTDNPESFTPRIVRLWERILRSSPTYDRDHLDKEIISYVRSDETLRLHWKTYQAFLTGFAKVKNMKREAGQAQARSHRIFDVLG